AAGGTLPTTVSDAGSRSRLSFYHGAAPGARQRGERPESPPQHDRGPTKQSDIIGRVSHPASIGRYRVLDVLGQGAMGVVYRGRDETLDRDVAIKVMSLGQGADAEGRARFLREARAAARLQHANIVTIYELGEQDGSPFMAMELLEGTDLQRAIEGGLRPDPRRTLPIVLQLLAGLGHAH